MIDTVKINVIEEIIKSLEDTYKENKNEENEKKENGEFNKSDEEKGEEENEKDEISIKDNISKYIEQKKFIENADVSFSSYSDKDGIKDNSEYSIDDISDVSLDSKLADKNLFI
jgi:hypothetical protein